MGWGGVWGLGFGVLGLRVFGAFRAFRVYASRFRVKGTETLNPFQGVGA